MKWFRTALLLVAVFGIIGALSRAHAQGTQPPKQWVLQSPMTSLGSYQCTSVSVATTLYGCAGLTAIPANSVFAVVQVEGETARWRCDGVAPTASVGQPLTAAQPIYFSCGVLGNVLLTDVQLIPETGSMTIDVSFFGIR